MSKRKSNRQQKRSQPRFQLATCEPLEARVLLAGDSFSAWQNPVNPYDVNQDSHVTPADLLIVRQVLNSQGAHELPVRASAEPGSAATPMMLDANGDGFVSAIDAYQVVQAINGQGEGEEFQFRLDINAIEPDDSTGNVIDEVNIGDSFRLSVYVQDLRGADAFGIFSAYADVTYDSALVSVADGSTVVHAAPFDDGRFSDLSVPGLIDEAGGFDQSGTGDGSEQLLFQLDMVADAAGVVDFQSDPADVIPLREFLSHESATPIDATNILFGSTQLTVVDDQAPVDLAGFAQALTDAGVEFWTTQQFNTDAVSQRALFEDAYVYLPINEALDSAGAINAAATAQNVTAVNTWIFPDDTQATGVLSLEELATRSGVSLPAYSGPTIRDPFADGTVSLEFGSPLNLGIDTYALSDGPITYTVTVDNPDLVESTVITGNRGWQLDVNGYGTMLFEFFENRASRATDQFISLTQDDFYDGLTFHRILEDFVIQGGDPLGTGTGGSDLPDFRDQFDVDLQHNQVGVLSMAKSADDTNNSQFFVTDGTPRHLDFNHTIFGQLIEGFDVLAGISAAPVQAPANQGRPVDSIVINSASVVDDQENGVVLLRALASTGTTNVTITATDGDGNSDSTTFEVNLAADAEDAQPFLLDIPEDLVAQAGTTFDFQVDGVDAEGDPINYDVNFTSPDGVTASVSDTGLVSVTIPDTVNAGDEVQIRVRAYDNFPNFTQSPRDEQLVTITVDDSIAVVDDAFSIDEDSGLHTFDVLANDTGSGLTITSVTTPADGATVEITTDNQIHYTPAPNFPLNSVGAQDSVFTYTVTSAGGQTATGTVTVTVTPVNDPPTANDDAFPADFTSIDTDQIARLREDATENALLRLILNDAVTPDEEIPGISATESLTGASLQVVNINTAVNYRAAANVFGTDTFTYTLTDPGGLSDTATVTVEIAQVNDAPETVDDAIEVVAGVASSISAATLLDNDTAGPLEDTVQTLSITSVTQPANGTVTLNSDGSLSYTANPGFSGTDTFTYTITDDGITENFDTGQNAFVAAADPLTATGTVTVTATVNEFAADDAFDVDGRRDTVSLDVLNNDDVTLSPTITSITQPTNGTAAIINNGLDISYSRNDNFVGNDSFTYTLTDSGGNTSTATVSLNVLDPVTPPIAQDDSFTVQNDGSEQSFSVLANDEVDAGETASIVSIQLAPTNGTASVSTSGDAILYTPNAGFAGTETIVYQMTDGNGGFDSASVTVTVEPTIVNPVANDDMVTFDGIPPQAFDVLANDTTEAGETLTIDSIVTPPTNGVASISTDGTQILYEPIDDQVTADTLVYRISDGNGGTDTATVSITIRQNEDPVAVADTFTINATGEQSLDVLANDTTEAGETLTISAITVAPNLGSATIAADGLSILYTPTPGTTDTDTLTYEISDGNGGTATAVVTLNVDVANQNPVAVDDTADLDHIGEQSIDVLANDTTEAGETLTITATGGTPAGSVTIGTDGTSILYTPAANAGGTTDSFTYTISDGNGGTAEGTVTVSIADNQNPVAVDETVTLDRTGEQTIDVLANDTTEAGETLTITATGGTPAGSVAISTDGTSILYTPATDAGGTSDSFTYTISDGNGGTAEGTVTVNIQANENPVANDDTASLMPTGEQTIDVLANDTTEAGETLTITAIGGTAAGTVSISTDGTSILYTPAANATGTTDTFTYTISDGNGGTSEATVTVNLADLSTSFVAGTIYQDVNGNGTQDANEPGIGGVPLVLEGTDVNNATVRMEVRSALDGSYRIEGIAPGDYSISQVQPELLASVSNSFGTEDTFDIQVSEDLIASDGNLFGESGLPLRFAMLDAITSNRTPGVLVVLQGDELSWMESRSGWEGVDSLMVTRSGDDLTIETSSGSTVVSMFDRSVVELIGGTSEFTILRLNGTSDQVMSAAAVDAVMAG